MKSWYVEVFDSWFPLHGSHWTVFPMKHSWSNAWLVFLEISYWWYLLLFDDSCCLCSDLLFLWLTSVKGNISELMTQLSGSIRGPPTVIGQDDPQLVLEMKRRFRLWRIVNSKKSLKFLSQWTITKFLVGKKLLVIFRIESVSWSNMSWSWMRVSWEGRKGSRISYDGFYYYWPSILSIRWKATKESLEQSNFCFT